MVLKAQIKKVTLKNGEEAFSVCGITLPCTELENVGNSHELWVMRLEVIESVSYSDNKGNPNISPEDFLSGEGQSPSQYTVKGINKHKK